MPYIRITLKPGQIKSLATAIKNKTGWALKLTKAQVMNASISSDGSSRIGADGKDQPHDLPIYTKAMHDKFASAFAAKRGVLLMFSKTLVQKEARLAKKGGFFGAIIPALLAALPGLLGSAPEILDGIKSGYETVGKLVGITPTGGAVDSKQLDKALDAVIVEQELGSSLHSFGTSLMSFGPVVSKGRKRVAKKKAAPQ